jgi:transposase
MMPRRICEAVTSHAVRGDQDARAAERPDARCSIARAICSFRQQTAVINAIRAYLAEFGIVAPVGRNGVEQLLGVVAKSK